MKTLHWIDYKQLASLRHKYIYCIILRYNQMHKHIRKCIDHKLYNFIHITQYTYTYVCLHYTSKSAKLWVGNDPTQNEP